MMAGEVAILISTLVKFQDMNQMRGVKAAFLPDHSDLL